MGKFKFLKKLTTFDIYGHEIKMLYKGKETKTSLVGAFFTFATVLLVLLYAAF